MTTTAEASASMRPASLPRELFAGVIGAGTTLVCLMPPILHVVTGPLGPFIGGFVAAKQVAPSPRAHAVIAGVIGVLIAGLCAAAVAVVTSRSGPPPDWLPSGDTLAIILAGVFLYTTGLAAAGVAIGHAMAEKRQRSQSNTKT